MTLEDHATLKLAEILCNWPEIKELPENVAYEEGADKWNDLVFAISNQPMSSSLHKSFLLRLNTAYQDPPKEWDEIINKRASKLHLPTSHRERVVLVVSHLSLMIGQFHALRRKIGRICDFDWENDILANLSRSLNGREPCAFCIQLRRPIYEILYERENCECSFREVPNLFFNERFVPRRQPPLNEREFAERDIRPRQCLNLHIPVSPFLSWNEEEEHEECCYRPLCLLSMKRKKAQSEVRKEHIEPITRFTHACNYGLAEDVILLWDEIPETEKRKTDWSLKIAFWIKLCLIAEELKNRHDFNCRETFNVVLNCVKKNPALDAVMFRLSLQGWDSD